MAMDHKAVEKQCEQFLKKLGVPGFIILGFQTTNEEFTVTYSFHKVTLKQIIPVIMSAVSNLIANALE